MILHMVMMMLMMTVAMVRIIITERILNHDYPNDNNADSDRHNNCEK